jgi:DNA repair protein SbcD/Mre11
MCLRSALIAVARAVRGQGSRLHGLRVETGARHRPVSGLALSAGQQGAAADRIRTATRVALDNLVGQALEEQVDFMLIAGDLYDGDWRDYQTGLFFVKQMGRLAHAGIPVFLLYGNHDAESQITRRLSLPANVSVFAARKPETFRLQHLDVALHGQSFRQRNVTDNLVTAYPAPIAGCFNISASCTPAWAGCRGTQTMHRAPSRI